AGDVRTCAIRGIQSIAEGTFGGAKYSWNGLTRRGGGRGGAVGGSRRGGGRMGIRGAGAWVYGGWRLVYTTTARHPCGYRAVDGRGQVSGSPPRTPVPGPAPPGRWPRRRRAPDRSRSRRSRSSGTAPPWPPRWAPPRSSGTGADPFRPG